MISFNETVLLNLFPECTLIYCSAGKMKKNFFKKNFKRCFSQTNFPAWAIANKWISLKSYSGAEISADSLIYMYSRMTHFWLSSILKGVQANLPHAFYPFSRFLPLKKSFFHPHDSFYFLSGLLWTSVKKYWKIHIYLLHSITICPQYNHVLLHSHSFQPS